MLKHLSTQVPLLLGFLLMIVGVFVAERFGLYDQFAHLDKVFHVLGGVVVAWMAMALLQDDVVKESWWKQMLVIVSVASFVGLLWEFAEYASNFTKYTHPLWYSYYHGGDLADTMGDLAADIVGGTSFALWALWKEKR